MCGKAFDLMLSYCIVMDGHMNACLMLAHSTCRFVELNQAYYNEMHWVMSNFLPCFISLEYPSLHRMSFLQFYYIAFHSKSRAACFAFCHKRSTCFAMKLNKFLPHVTYVHMTLFIRWAIDLKWKVCCVFALWRHLLLSVTKARIR